MRDLYTLTMVTVATLLLSACGGGGNSTGTQSTGTMLKGTAYTINEGDSIVKDSDPTVVVIETDITTGTTTATLQSGSAKIFD